MLQSQVVAWLGKPFYLTDVLDCSFLAFWGPALLIYASIGTKSPYKTGNGHTPHRLRTLFGSPAYNSSLPFIPFQPLSSIQFLIWPLISDRPVSSVPAPLSSSLQLLAPAAQAFQPWGTAGSDGTPTRYEIVPCTIWEVRNRRDHVPVVQCKSQYRCPMSNPRWTAPQQVTKFCGTLRFKGKGKGKKWARLFAESVITFPGTR